MNYQGFIIMLLFAVTVACQRGSDELQGVNLSGVPIVLTTRAAGNENPVFTNDDRMGMFVTTAGVELTTAGNLYANAVLTLGEGGWTGGAMYYPNTSNVDIYAYFPYRAEVTDIKAFAATVGADQSVAGAYKKSDFLWAKIENRAKTEGELALALKHRMSKAEVRLIAGAGITDDYLKTVVAVKLLHLRTTAIADLSTGEVSVADEAVDMTVTAASAGDFLWMAIIVPQTLPAGTDAIEITMADGTKRLYRLDNEITYQPGKVKHFDITVSNEALTVSVVSIEEWTSDGMLSGVARIEISTPQISDHTTEGTHFSDGTKLGMYFFAQDAMMEDGGNVLYTAAAGGTVSSSTTLYYPTGDEVNIYAYAPFKEGIRDMENYSFHTGVDQRTEADWAQSDLLVAKTEGLTNGGPAADLTFRHIMSQLVVNLLPGNGMKATDLAGVQVSVMNVMRQAQVNLKTGQCKSLSDENGITPFQEEMTSRAILIPQTLQVTKTFLKITLGNSKAYTYKSGMALKSGSRHTLNITVSNDGISVGTPVITAWEEEAPVSGDAVKLIPQGALLDGEAVSPDWDKVVSAGGDVLLTGEKYGKIYVYIRPEGYDGVIIEFNPDGLPGRVITANNTGLHDLALFFPVTPEGSHEEQLGLGIVTTNKQIALLEPEPIPEVLKSGKLTGKVQYVVNKLAEVLQTNGMTEQLPPANLGCSSVLINLLPQVDMDNLPSFAENGSNVLEQAGMENAGDIVSVTDPAGDMLVGAEGTEAGNAFEATEQEYQTEVDLIQDASKYGFGDVKITLKWDSEGDVDLHVKDPDDHYIYYNAKKPSGCEGYLDVDNTKGYGPENIFFAKNQAPQGIYKIKVNKYGSMASAGYTLFIYAKGKAKTYSGSITSGVPKAFFEFDLNGNFRNNTTSW